MKRWFGRITAGFMLAAAIAISALWVQSYYHSWHTPLNGVHYPAFGFSWNFMSVQGKFIARWNEILPHDVRKWFGTDFQNLGNFAVIGFRRAPAGTPAAPDRVWAEHGAIGVRYWFVDVIAISWPAVWMYRRVRDRMRFRAVGRCITCGYDLRATPDRCPECGTVVAVTP